MSKQELSKTQRERRREAKKKNELMLNLDSLKSVFQREKKEEGQTIEGARIVEVELRKSSPWKDGCPGI